VLYWAQYGDDRVIETAGTYNLRSDRGTRSVGVGAYYFFSIPLEVLLRAGGPWIPG
jgi:hypothetical protein